MVIHRDLQLPAATYPYPPQLTVLYRNLPFSTAASGDLVDCRMLSSRRRQLHRNLEGGATAALRRLRRLCRNLGLSRDREIGMSSKLSVEDLLANLEKR